jgi:hypothetical protein
MSIPCYFLHSSYLAEPQPQLSLSLSLLSLTCAHLGHHKTMQASHLTFKWASHCPTVPRHWPRPKLTPGLWSKTQNFLHKPPVPLLCCPLFHEKTQRVHTLFTTTWPSTLCLNHAQTLTQPMPTFYLSHFHLHSIVCSTALPLGMWSFSSLIGSFPSRCQFSFIRKN